MTNLTPQVKQLLEIIRSFQIDAKPSLDDGKPPVRFAVVPVVLIEGAALLGDNAPFRDAPSLHGALDGLRLRGFIDGTIVQHRDVGGLDSVFERAWSTGPQRFQWSEGAKACIILYDVRPNWASHAPYMGAILQIDRQQSDGQWKRTDYRPGPYFLGQTWGYSLTPAGFEALEGRAESTAPAKGLALHPKRGASLSREQVAFIENQGKTERHSEVRQAFRNQFGFYVSTKTISKYRK